MMKLFTAPTATKLEKRPGCIQAALSIIGDKWTALIIRDLWRQPKRFSELQRSLGKISPRTLSQRLDKMAECGVLLRSEQGEYPVYSLTRKGLDFAGILEQMAEWGEKYAHPAHSN